MPDRPQRKLSLSPKLNLIKLDKLIKLPTINMKNIKNKGIAPNLSEK